MLITDIKNAIKTKFDGLKTAGTLGEVQVDDFKVDFLDRDIAVYPCAIITSPTVEGGYFTNNQNERTYTFNVAIVNKGENIATANDIETLAETIIDAFDNDPTLGGKADGGVEPSSSAPEPVTSQGKSFVVFTITIKAKAIKDLTFGT